MRFTYNPRIRIFKWLQTTYDKFLTPTGKMVFWALVIATGVGLYSFTIKIYLVFIVLSCLFLVSFVYAGFFSWLTPPRITVEHFPPERSTCGHQVSFKVRMKNHSKKEYFDLFVRENTLPPSITELNDRGSYTPSLAPLAGQEVDITLAFGKRGHYVLSGLIVETSFPFGLWRGRRHYRHERSLLVYPRFHPLKTLSIPVGKRYQPGGIALTSNLGESTEFIGTREFREGDNVRDIHWRSWARTGKPVVKEFQEEYFCRIALVLDTYVPPGSQKKVYEALESAISLSAAIADNLSKQEYIIDIFAAGPNLYYLQAGRSLAYLENILDILACIDHCETPPFDRLEPVLLENLTQITTCIMVFLDWDETRERLVRTATGLGTAVKVFIVRDSEPSVDPAPYEDLVGGITRISPDDERRGVEDL